MLDKDFIPLEWTCALSQGIYSLVDDATDAICRQISSFPVWRVVKGANFKIVSIPKRDFSSFPAVVHLIHQGSKELFQSLKGILVVFRSLESDFLSTSFLVSIPKRDFSSFPDFQNVHSINCILYRFNP